MIDPVQEYEEDFLDDEEQLFQKFSHKAKLANQRKKDEIRQKQKEKQKEKEQLLESELQVLIV